MFTRKIQKGTTDVSVVIRIIDSSDGTPETAVEHNTSGIDLQYRREGAASTAITEAALASLTTAHTDGGIEHIGNGYYRLDLPDAACASGVDGVLVHGTVTGMIVIGTYIELVDYDPYDGISLGLSSLSDIESSLVIVKSDLVLVSSDTTAIESELIVVHSETTAIQSDTTQVQSDTAVLEAAVSDVESSLVIVKSDLVLVSSDTAAIESELIVVHSETTAIQAAGGGLTAGQASQLTAIQSDTTQIQSDTAVIEAAGGGLTVAQASQLAQAHSDIIIIGSDVVLVYSDTTAIHSQTTVVESDTTVLEAGVNVTQINSSAPAAQLLEDQLVAYETGTAQAGAAGSITLAASGPSATNDYYNGQFVWIMSGTGAGQVRQITDYVGSTKVASVEPNWATNPSTDSVYVLVPVAAAPDTSLPDVNVTQFGGTTVTAKDVGSAITVLQSDAAAIHSDTTIIASDVVQVYSDTTAIYSDTTVISSDTAAIEAGGGSLTAAQASQLTAIQSDTTQIQSDTTVIEAGGGSLTATQASQLARIQSDTIIIGSDLLQVYSDTTVIASDVAALPIASAIADAVWDEVITGAEHNVATSAARFLRESAQSQGITGTAQAGAATTITLEAGASATDDIYNFEAIVILEGTGAGQARLITDYNGTTKVATVNRAWTVNPSSDSIYSIAGADAVVEAIGNQTVTATVPVDFDDLATLTSDVVQIYSDTAAIETATSSAASDLAAIESELIVVHSETTAVQSDTTALGSAVSDVESSLVIVKSDLVQVYSDTTAIHSETTVIISQRSVPAQGAAFTFNFKMVDSTDFATPETGRTVTATRSIDGSAFGSATGTVTEIANGIYEMAASAADMNGGVIVFRFTATGCAATEVEVITDGGV